jgi:hypothetical protein
MRCRRTSVTVSALASLTLLSVFGMGAAHAVASAGSPNVPAPKLIHTGNAYSAHAVTASARSATAFAAHSGLNFVATFDTSITTDPNAAAIEAGIMADLNALHRLVLTPVTVTIEFASETTGLGGAATYYNVEPYSTYRSDLARQASRTPLDKRALRSLPATSTNPVNGDADVNMTLPLLRATGEAALGNTGDHVDSTIFLNTSLLNLSRTGPQDPDKYDLQQVAMHEICEVLGAGGAGDSLLSGQVGPMDLFRYSASGVRSYTTDPNEQAYFSVNGGVTNRGFFNQDSGGDYGDWSSDLNGRAQVQDAFSTPGVQLNLDSSEKTALDVLGYHLR